MADENLIDFVVKLRDALAAAVEACKQYIETQTPKDWREIKAKVPLNPEDRALKWLEKKLSEIKARHPELVYEFVKENGKVLGLRYSAMDDEVSADVESPTLWAFSKAEQRPA